MRRCCQLLSISVSSYYASLRRKPSLRERDNERLTKSIAQIHRESKASYGSPRIHAELSANGEICSVHRVAKLMKLAGIAAKTKKKFKATTDSRHKLPVAPNLIERNFAPQKANETWASDITYLWTDEGWLYLAVVMDLYSRKIVGWSMAENMRTGLVLSALDMAVNARKPAAGLIHHSDRGSQYASKIYQAKLKAHGIASSMSGKGECWDNACVESFFGTLKREEVFHERYQTREQARRSVFDFIEVRYNRKRRHSTLGYLSPVKFEELTKVA